MLRDEFSQFSRKSCFPAVGHATRWAVLWDAWCVTATYNSHLMTTRVMLLKREIFTGRLKLRSGLGAGRSYEAWFRHVRTRHHTVVERRACPAGRIRKGPTRASSASCHRPAQRRGPPASFQSTHPLSNPAVQQGEALPERRVRPRYSVLMMREIQMPGHHCRPRMHTDQLIDQSRPVRHRT